MNEPMSERTWGMLLHLSQLSNFIVPMAGIVVPIVIWQLKKDEMPGIDAHGKIVVNWLLTCLIYGIVFAILSIFLIGIPLLLVLGLLGIIFPIVGGIKANNGETWKYPLSFKFF